LDSKIIKYCIEKIDKLADGTLVTLPTFNVRRTPFVVYCWLDLGHLVYIGYGSPMRAFDFKNRNNSFGIDSPDSVIVLVQLPTKEEARKVEKMLIDLYAPPWNKNGIGDVDD